MIPDYRVPVFDKLSDHLKSLCVVHTGAYVENTRFSQIVLKDYRVLKRFHYQYIKTDSVQQYDVSIIMFDIYWLSFISLLFSDVATKKILWGHGLGNYSKKNPLITLIRRKLAKRADALIFYDDDRKNIFIGNDEKLRRKSFSAYNSIVVLNHGYEIKNVRTNLLFVGRIEKHKNLFFLLDTFKSILHQLPHDLILEIVGDGSELEAIKNYVKFNHIEERVVFHGKVTEANQLKDLFNRAIALVHPAPLGLVVNHAFAYGVPIVSLSNIPHGTEIQYLSATNSLLSSKAEFANNLVELANTPERCQFMGEQAYKTFIDKCSIDRMINGFLEAIEYATAIP